MLKYLSSDQGFTLVEIVVVMAIMTSVFLFSNFIFVNRQPLTELDNVSLEILQILRLAQNQSLARKNENSWGLYFDELDDSVYTLYAGDSFEFRNENYDQFFDTGEMISFSLDPDIHDIHFSSTSGFLLSPVSISVAHSGLVNRKIIDINELGKIERND